MTGPDATPPVVVTRPAPDHRELIQALQARGLPALHCPAFTLVELPDAAARLARLTGTSRIIVTSPEAARILIRRVPAGLVDNAVLLAPGSGTAAVLRDAGYRVVVPAGAAASEALLELPELQAPAGLSVGIIAAPGGRALLAETLTQRGARVQRVEVYCRRALHPASGLLRLLGQGCRPRILVSSVNIVEHFDGALPAELKAEWRSSCFIVSSARVAAACTRRGARHVVVAGGPSAEALLAALDALS